MATEAPQKRVLDRIGPEFKGYLTDRATNPATLRASRFTREVFPGRVDLYQNALHSAASEIVTVLGMDPSFFDDPLQCEVFFEICDSWAVNKIQKGSKGYSKERSFLFDTARLLTGDYAEYNRNAYKAHPPGAEEYVYASGTRRNDQLVEALKLCRESFNFSITRLVTLECNKFGEGTLLNGARLKLGIRSHDDETAYKICIVGQEGTSKENWRKILEKGGLSLGVAGFADWESSVFVLPSHILKDSENGGKRQAQLYVQHEYGHTQRKYCTGARKILGRFWEENMAGQVASGFTHPEYGNLFSYLCRMARDVNRQDLESVFESSFKETDGTVKFYKYVADTFGIRSALLLLSTFEPTATLDEKRGKKVEDKILSLPFYYYNLLGSMNSFYPRHELAQEYLEMNRDIIREIHPVRFGSILSRLYFKAEDIPSMVGKFTAREY